MTGVHLASPFPTWLAIVVVGAVALVAYLSYRRLTVPLTPVQRGTLMSLRGLALALVVLFACRPVVLEPPRSDRAMALPVLVDVSRSMRIADAGGKPRIEVATQVLNELWPEMSQRFTPELYTFGDSLTSSTLGALKAEARHTDLSGAIATIRERYRGRPIPGIVVLSDGADTNQQPPAPGADGKPPIFAVGIGSADGFRDREVLNIDAGDPRLDESLVDVRVSVVSHSFGRAPFEMRLLGNGRLLETRRVVPASDGSPMEESFAVSPDPAGATVYSAEIVAAPDEPVGENNSRSVLVSPAGRKRHVLVVEGLPGFEHGFLTRALAHDSMLDVDSVVRKGKNENGQDTFFVQAGTGRAMNLASGFPEQRDMLFGYDAIIVTNVGGDFFTRAQLGMMRDFVSERGGGLLVMGGRSFAERGLMGTPLEEVLPVELNDRRGGLAPVRLADGTNGGHDTVALTAEGQNHPIMRMGVSPEETRKRWASLPALAESAALGGPKPGATVLAVTSAAGGALRPIVAVQRYGRGRSMIFAGEAAWRWRMMQPSGDHSYEYFWRQAARWLAGPSPDPVSIAASGAAEPGDDVAIGVEVRDRAFAPVTDAHVAVTMTNAAGTSQPLALRRETAAGRFTATVRPEQAGLYRIRVEASRGSASLGNADRWLYVGGSDREFTDPRLNEGLLRRLARDSGGGYVTAGDAARLLPSLESSVPTGGQPERRELWHEPWAFALVILLLSAEWIFRRRWGLR